VKDTEISLAGSVEFVIEKQLLFKNAFPFARKTLRNTAERSKKRYNMSRALAKMATDLLQPNFGH